MNSEIIPIEQDIQLSERAQILVDNVKSKANSRLAGYEQKIKHSPAKAVLIALGAGYCLNRLPVASLIAVPLRLTAVLAKPALLVLGAAKLYDLVEKQSRR